MGMPLGCGERSAEMRSSQPRASATITPTRCALSASAIASTSTVTPDFLRRAAKEHHLNYRSAWPARLPDCRVRPFEWRGDPQRGAERLRQRPKRCRPLDRGHHILVELVESRGLEHAHIADAAVLVYGESY